MEQFSLSVDFMDRYIFKCKPEYALVYLCAYRHRAENRECPSPQQLAQLLDLPEDTVLQAVRYWSGLGFDIFRNGTPDAAAEKKAYTPAQLAAFSQQDDCLAFLYAETSRMLGKVLSSSELQTLFWIYDCLGLSAPVILMLINYAVKEGKGRIRYIEKVAIAWAEQGITSLARAEAYLASLEQRGRYEQKIKKLFGIGERALTSAERKIAEEWRTAVKPTQSQLREAYSICVERTGKFSMRYINGILKNWAEDTEKGRTDGKAVPTPRSTKFKNFDSTAEIDYEKRELDALKRKLEKTRKAGTHNAEPHQ